MTGTNVFSLLGRLAIDGVDKAEKDLENISKTSEKTAKSTKQLGATYTELQNDVKRSEERLSALKDEHANVVLQQGKNSKSAKDLEAQMKELNKGIETDKKRLKEAEEASKDFTTALGKSSKEVKTAGDRFQELGTKAGELGKKLAIGLAGIVTASVAGVEATREFRQDFGKLETTFETTNQKAGVAERTFKTLFGVLGEDDTAIETANHLAMMTNNEKDLAQWTDVLTGVYATFGDSLPLEGLAEAANETARVGQVTGPLADALNWAGVSEDEFNKKLEKTNSTAEREKMIRETLNGLYGEASATYKDVNGNVIANNEAQAELNMTFADATAKIEPLVTKGKEFIADVLIKMQPLIDWVVENFDLIAPIILTIVGALTLFSVTMGIVNAVMMASPVTWIVLAIVAALTALVAIIVVVVKNWDTIKEATSNAINKMKEVVSTGIEKIKSFFEKIINFVKENWQGLLLLLVNPIAGAFKLLYDNCEGFRNFVDNFVKKIKDFFVNGFNTIKTKVVSTVTNLVDGVKNKFNSFKDGVTNIFNKVKTAITSPIEKARDVIKGVVDKIKGFFNFNISLPKIKLPHFSIKPSGWKIGDLLKGSIPKLGIDWYAKAMNNPMLLQDPTAFGFSPSGNIRVGGEAGDEIVGGANTIMGMISDAVSVNNGGIENKLDRLIGILTNYLPALSNQQVVLSTGELVGAMVNPMDKALGNLADSRRRGR